MQLRNGRSLGWAQIYLNAKTIPFWGVHLAALVGIALLGFSWAGLGLAILLYLPRMFFVTAGYHRYFSHRSYRTSRVFQFVMALGAVTTGQKGVLWWASHHRKHHRFSDEPGDVHSPRDGFWWSHMGWIMSYENESTDVQAVRDLARFPELMLLERFWMVPPVAAAVATFAVGGWFALVWGYFVAQVLLWHGTFTINSLSHVIGTRRFATSDDSRNHWALALITLGEGWHNNHHHRPGVARQGLMWWEVDGSYYVLRALAALGVVWDLRAAPVKEKAKAAASEAESPAEAVSDLGVALVPRLPTPVASESVPSA